MACSAEEVESVGIMHGIPDLILIPTGMILHEHVALFLADCFNRLT